MSMDVKKLAKPSLEHICVILRKKWWKYLYYVQDNFMGKLK